MKPHVQDASLTIKVVFAVPPSEESIKASQVPPLSTQISERTLTLFNSEFVGKRSGNRVFLVSQRLPQLVRLRQKYAFASEVVGFLSKSQGSGTCTLVPFRSLSIDSQKCYTLLLKEQFGLEADTPSLQAQAFGFFVDARVEFGTTLGVRRVNFVGGPDSDRDLMEFERVNDKTGTAIQDPKVTYDRATFPEVKSSTYRIALGFLPEARLDAESCKALQEVVEEVIEEQELAYALDIERKCQTIFERNPKYFFDVANKSPLGEAQILIYKAALKSQLTDEGFNPKRIEEVVSAARVGKRQLRIYCSNKLSLGGSGKQLNVPTTTFIWP